MAKAERRGNPLGWILLGFLVGAVAAVVVIFAVGAGVGFDSGGYEDGPEVRTSASEGAVIRTPAVPASPADPATPAGPAAPEQPPLVQAPPVTPPPAPASPRAEPEVDPQIADDAAAAGMTSRTR